MKTVNEDILNTLTKVAVANPNLTEKLAAAIVHRNKIISIGMNRMKTHPLAVKYGRNKDAIYLHAEIDSIKNALREIDIDNFEKCDIYVVRVKKEKPFGKKYIWGLAKPCSGCQKAIQDFGIRRVIYTCNDQTYEVM